MRSDMGTVPLYRVSVALSPVPIIAVIFLLFVAGKTWCAGPTMVLGSGTALEGSRSSPTATRQVSTGGALCVFAILFALTVRLRPSRDLRGELWPFFTS